jgi:hypothetical protein
MKKKEITNDQEVQDQSKREFLRKSSYAAYMAPAMMSLVVEKASAACSQFQNPKRRARCEATCAERPNKPYCQ